MIKFLITVLILAAALYFWKRYQEAKRRELAERDAEAWLNFYAGYTGGSWEPVTGTHRPTMQKTEIGILHRIIHQMPAHKCSCIAIGCLLRVFWK